MISWKHMKPICSAISNKELNQEKTWYGPFGESDEEEKTDEEDARVIKVTDDDDDDGED